MACRLALALGFDVSSSVDAADYAIQRDGIVAALEAPEIRRAFLAPDEPVALAIFEWGARQRQVLVVDWLVVREAADLDRVAETLRLRGDLRPWEPTAIGAALSYARELFAAAPSCAARTLDLSGDGRNNDWLAPARVYAREDFGDILVNGLAIGGHEADIAAYYAREVIRGPGAFVVTARTHTDFPPAIRRKLERELTGPVFGARAPAPAARG
ncbi:MAG: DUF1194 domain-containing protein [Paracoccaceae bacterium]|nr:DUF1194 domain-containing protein [Paracoccaceae bacterium]